MKINELPDYPRNKLNDKDLLEYLFTVNYFACEDENGNQYFYSITIEDDELIFLPCLYNKKFYQIKEFR